MYFRKRFACGAGCCLPSSSSLSHALVRDRIFSKGLRNHAPFGQGSSHARYGTSIELKPSWLVMNPRRNGDALTWCISLPEQVEETLPLWYHTNMSLVQLFWFGRELRRVIISREMQSNTGMAHSFALKEKNRRVIGVAEEVVPGH
jgi:hypothetical protein